jgi:hypothetical protein
VRGFDDETFSVQSGGDERRTRRDRGRRNGWSIHENRLEGSTGRVVDHGFYLRDSAKNHAKKTAEFEQSDRNCCQAAGILVIAFPRGKIVQFHKLAPDVGHRS